jgi:hypothetical protein
MGAVAGEVSAERKIEVINKDKTHITISKQGRLDQIMHIFSLGENINPAVFCFFVLYRQTLHRGRERFQKINMFYTLDMLLSFFIF